MVLHIQGPASRKANILDRKCYLHRAWLCPRTDQNLNQELAKGEGCDDDVHFGLLLDSSVSREETTPREQCSLPWRSIAPEGNKGIP